MIEKYVKSSYSSGGGQGSCVELEVTRLASVRDSKNVSGPVLRFQDRGPITRLLAAVKRGEL